MVRDERVGQCLGPGHRLRLAVARRLDPQQVVGHAGAPVVPHEVLRALPGAEVPQGAVRDPRGLQQRGVGADQRAGVAGLIPLVRDQHRGHRGRRRRQHHRHRHAGETPQQRHRPPHPAPPAHGGHQPRQVEERSRRLHRLVRPHAAPPSALPRRGRAGTGGPCEGIGNRRSPAVPVPAPSTTRTREVPSRCVLYGPERPGPRKTGVWSGVGVRCVVIPRSPSRCRRRAPGRRAVRVLYGPGERGAWSGVGLWCVVIPRLPVPGRWAVRRGRWSVPYGPGPGWRRRSR